MRLTQGVEWGLHVCLTLGWLEPGRTATADQLAEYFDLPKAYLHKQVRALCRAGIVTSTPGPRGGYCLARSLDEITLMDVVTAIEGEEPAFRCTEIRRQGVSGEITGSRDTHCLIELAMRRADLAWRREARGPDAG